LGTYVNVEKEGMSSEVDWAGLKALSLMCGKKQKSLNPQQGRERDREQLLIKHKGTNVLAQHFSNRVQQQQGRGTVGVVR